MTGAAVLITTCDGDVDYVSVGDVNVVFVDFDKYRCETGFPDDVNEAIRQLKTLPAMPWATELVRRLCLIRNEIRETIRNEPPPREEAQDDRTDAGREADREPPAGPV